jgi:hypothetical protein
LKSCTQCSQTKDASDFYFKNNSKVILRPECKICTNLYNSEQQKKNKIQRNQYKKNWSKKNPLSGKLAGKAWRKNNKGKANHFTAKRRSALLQRTPKWLSADHIKEIEQFYIDAAYLTNYTKTTFEVDHIVPLRGEKISGFHVPWNLQLLTEFDNRSKGNKL